VIVDDELKETNPSLYQYVLDFAKKNHLQVKEDD
jgi:hypothetical protein